METKPSAVRDITDADFVNEIQNDAGIVVLKFYRTSCQSCKVFEPVYDSLARLYEGKIKFLQLNTDTSGTFHYRRLGVTGDPSTYVFYKGNPEGHFTGAALGKYFEPIMANIFTDMGKRLGIAVPAPNPSA